MGRKTISIDDMLEETLRDIQSRFIKADTRSWSLSKIVNLVLMCAIMNSEHLSINDWNQLRAYVMGKNLPLKDADTQKFVENLLLVNQY